jgi:hypothetical protein
VGVVECRYVQTVQEVDIIKKLDLWLDNVPQFS